MKNKQDKIKSKHILFNTAELKQELLKEIATNDNNAHLFKTKEWLTNYLTEKDPSKYFNYKHKDYKRCHDWIYRNWAGIVQTAINTIDTGIIPLIEKEKYTGQIHNDNLNYIDPTDIIYKQINTAIATIETICKMAKKLHINGTILSSQEDKLIMFNQLSNIWTGMSELNAKVLKTKIESILNANRHPNSDSNTNTNRITIDNIPVYTLEEIYYKQGMDALLEDTITNALNDITEITNWKQEEIEYNDSVKLLSSIVHHYDKLRIIEYSLKYTKKTKEFLLEKDPFVSLLEIAITKSRFKNKLKIARPFLITEVPKLYQALLNNLTEDNITSRQNPKVIDSAHSKIYPIKDLNNILIIRMNNRQTQNKEELEEFTKEGTGRYINSQIAHYNRRYHTMCLLLLGVLSLSGLTTMASLQGSTRTV
ncbi:hypothetical protein NEOKW01_0722 [Nematocida sp. AWRm80]|nr:hypothetical protein NEOKW01_0722 [Nematocida sp. AWRm80]